jgi:uncharacterized protein YyaL (SSP411 family)
VLREMVTPEGGFCSAQDADSEGEEGRWYVWTPAELESVLGRQRARWAAAWWDVSDAGSFEHGTSILWRPSEAEHVARELKVDAAELAAAMDEARAALCAARERRVRPATDDKLLVAWNGLMISALAQTWQALGGEELLSAATRAARWILTHMGQPDGRLFATARAGRARIDAGLDDYAFLVQGLIDLYESDFDARWIEAALALCAVVEREFADGERGGWFTAGASSQPLIARLKSTHDGALPSGAGVHVLNLLRLAELTGQGHLAQSAQAGILSLGALVERHPAAFSQLLLAVDFLAVGPREIVVAGARGSSAAEALLETVRSRFLPQKVVARAHPAADVDLMPLLEGKSAPEGEGRAYVCRNWACAAPVATPSELEAALAE